MRAHSQGCGRSVDRGTCRPGIEPRNTCPVAKAAGGPGCRGYGDKPKVTPGLPLWQGSTGPRAVTDPVHARKHFAREPGGPRAFCNIECRAHREAFGRTPVSHGAGKSDCCVVPKKPPNKAGSEMAWQRRWWREGGGPRELCLTATRTGHRTPDTEPGSRDKRLRTDTTGRILLA